MWGRGHPRSSSLSPPPGSASHPAPTAANAGAYRNASEGRTVRVQGPHLELVAPQRVRRLDPDLTRRDESEPPVEGGRPEQRNRGTSVASAAPSTACSSAEPMPCR